MKKVFLILAIFLLSYQITNAQYIHPPSELEAEPEDPLYIKVKWHDNSNNEDGFYIERATDLDSANWEAIGVVAANIFIFPDYWVTNGMKYYYRSYAFNGSGYSDYSNVDSTIAGGDTVNLPPRPTNLRVTNTTSTSISVLWDDNATNEHGFIIARKKQGDVIFEYIDTVGMDVLTYQDVGLTPDRIYFYKVCAYNGVGISDYSNTVSATTKESTGVIINYQEIPRDFFISSNYPNPFNPVTNIKFGIPSPSFVRIRIYDSRGKEVESLLDQHLATGTYTVRWSADRFSSGVYFYGIEADDFTDMKKMILLK